MVQTIIESSTSAQELGNISISPAGIIHQMDSSLCEFLGWAAKDLEKIPARLLIHPDDRFSFGNWIDDIQNRKQCSGALRLQHHNGNWMPFCFNGEIAEGEQLRFRLTPFVHINDIPMSEALEQRQHLETIGILTAGLVHDFNNALSIMIGQAQVLQSVCEPAILSKLEKIVLTGKRVSSLANQLLKLSRDVHQNPEPQLLAPLLQEACTLLEAWLPPSIRLYTQLHDQKAGAVISANEFYRIIFNLCLNAADAIHDHGTLTINLETGELPPSDQLAWEPVSAVRWAILDIGDTGKGIPDTIREHIFSPFFSTKEKGSGLGLSSVVAIVKDRGGAMGVESDPEKGTHFRIYLPYSDVESGSIAIEEASQTTVLVVDDNPEVCDMISMMLTHLGCQHRVAHTVPEALALLQDAPDSYAGALVDVILPGDNGIVLAKEIHTRYQDLPVVLVSALGRTLAVNEAIDNGYADSFICKPLSLPELRTVVDRWVKRAH